MSLGDMSVVVYVFVFIGNVSVGFDVLGVVVFLIDGMLFGDWVKVEVGVEVFILKMVGWFVDKFFVNL